MCMILDMGRAKRIFKRTSLGFFTLLLVILGGGFVYQSIGERIDSKTWPPPGELHEVDGTMMHLHCTGSGSPTVILEQGLGMTSVYWSDIQEKISTSTRVCSYDRAGYGDSEPVGHGMPAKEVASRLASLLQKAKVQDDLVLVGFSAGGVYIREFYRQHPSKVLGMVFVDSTHEEQGTRLPKWPPPTWDMKYSAFLGPLGYFRATKRLQESFGWLNASDEVKQRLHALELRAHFVPAVLAETDAFLADVSHGAKPAKLGDLPVTVMSRGKPVWRPDWLPEHITLESLKEERKVWDVLQQELTTLSTNTRHVVAKNSDHGIWHDEPELVVSNVLELVDRLQDKAPQASPRPKPQLP